MSRRAAQDRALDVLLRIGVASVVVMAVALGVVVLVVAGLVS